MVTAGCRTVGNVTGVATPWEDTSGRLTEADRGFIIQIKLIGLETDLPQRGVTVAWDAASGRTKD